MQLKNTIQVFLFVLILSSIKLSVIAQYQGVVSNTKKEVIDNVSLMLLEKRSGRVIAFTFTNKEGIFQFTRPPISDTLILTASHLGYKSWKIEFTSEASKNFNILLFEDPKELPEVTVRNKGIFQVGDTLNYSMSEFIQKQDMVIADVLRRLPGIEVLQNGIIKYQGRTINKYYIEGLDMLEDKYNLANQNIPAKAVNSVQVIENHQPVKALEDYSISNQAALNIKLKNEYKGKIFGRAKAGIGTPPLLADIELVPMKFSGNEQAIGVYKYNNVGKDYARELDQLYLSENPHNIKANLFLNPQASIPFPSNPTGTLEKSLFNNLHVGSFNYLKKLNKDYELKFQLDGVTDKQQEQAGNTITYYFPGDTIIIKENQDAKKKIHLLRGTAILESNTQKMFLKNIFAGEINGLQNTSYTVANQKLNQDLQVTARNFKNQFSILKRTKNNLKRISSFISYQYQPETFIIEPGVHFELFNNNNYYDKLFQPSSLSTFFTDNSIGQGLKWKSWAIEYGAGLSYLRQTFNSSLNLISQKDSIKPTNFKNDFVSSETSSYAYVSLSRTYKQFKVNLSTPITHLSFLSKDDIEKREIIHKNKLVINYSAALSFHLNSRWKALLDLKRNTNFRPPNTNVTNDVVRSYRMINRQAAFVKATNYRTANFALNYKDVVKNIFLNGGIRISEQQQNYMSNQFYSGSLFETQTEERNNDMSAKQFYFSGNKYFFKIKTAISAELFFNQSTSHQLYENSLSDFRSNTTSAKFSTNTSLGVINTSYTAEYSKVKYGILTEKREMQTTVFNQLLEVNTNLPFNTIAQFNLEQNNLKTKAQKSYVYYFAGLALRKKFVTQKIETELLWQNIFNAHHFTTINVYNNIQSLSYFNLRPAEVLLKVYVNF